MFDKDGWRRLECDWNELTDTDTKNMPVPVIVEVFCVSCLVTTTIYSTLRRLKSAVPPETSLLVESEGVCKDRTSQLLLRRVYITTIKIKFRELNWRITSHPTLIVQNFGSLLFDPTSSSVTSTFMTCKYTPAYTRCATHRRLTLLRIFNFACCN